MGTNGLTLEGKVALVTGGARRIGAVVARTLHSEGMSIALTYRHSAAAAEALRDELNMQRPRSVHLFQCDLLVIKVFPKLVERVLTAFGRLDALVNNASTFYPTTIGSITERAWDDLIGTNLKAPLFLAQAAAPHLAACRGAVVNISDVYGLWPLKDHAVYCAAKAGLIMLTKSLARDLGPEVRVNSVAPGAVLWPERGLDELSRQRLLSRTALRRQGAPQDVARAILFLLRDATYTTGDVVYVDGGHLLGP